PTALRTTFIFKKFKRPDLSPDGETLQVCTISRGVYFTATRLLCTVPTTCAPPRQICVFYSGRSVYFTATRLCASPRLKCVLHGDRNIIKWLKIKVKCFREFIRYC